MALKRLTKELKEAESGTWAEGISAAPDGDDMFKWVAIICGPEATCYEGGVFFITVEIPQVRILEEGKWKIQVTHSNISSSSIFFPFQDYPFRPPKLRFTTPIYHPNVSRSSGGICVSITKPEGWSPSLTIEKVLISIRSLLDDPNWEDPLEPELSNLHHRNPKEFARLAKEHTIKFATWNVQPVITNSFDSKGKIKLFFYCTILFLFSILFYIYIYFYFYIYFNINNIYF